MSGLSQAVPLALAAAIYPPAILVCALLLTGDRPRLLVSAYLAGAALVVVAVGLAGLVLAAPLVSAAVQISKDIARARARDEAEEASGEAARAEPQPDG